MATTDEYVASILHFVGKLQTLLPPGDHPAVNQTLKEVDDQLDTLVEMIEEGEI